MKELELRTEFSQFNNGNEFILLTYAKENK